MTEETQKPTKLIAVYGRVSTSNQENEGTIETQLSAVREFAQKNRYTVAQEYLDEGWSGDSIVRPALDQLRMDAKKKIWDAVLMYDPDRLARRYSYQELVADELREAGIELIFVTVSAPKNPEDKILHGVRGLFAEYERAKISERFRLGKLRKVKEGHILTTEAPYGYTYIRGDRERRVHGYYVINEEEAKVVKMIFSWIADEGMAIREIVRQLQKLGIRPRKSKRGVWNTSSLHNMLRNKTYIGEGHWGSSYAVVPKKPIKIEKYKKTRKSSRRMKPEEEWIASKIPVPAILSRDLFERVRTQLKKNSTLCPRNRKYEYLLSGKIFCDCGRTRSGAGPQHGKHLYYRCNDRIYCFPLPRTCMDKGINAQVADKMVWDKISDLMSSPDLMFSQANRWMNERRDKIKSSIGDTKTVEKEVVKLKEQEERFNKAYGAGLFTIEKLKEYTVPIRDRLILLESQIAKAEQEENQINGSAVPTKNEIRLFAKEATKALAKLNFETKRAIITHVLDKVIGSQQRLEVHGYLPITTNHVMFKTSNRHCWSPQCWQINAFQGVDKQTGGYSELSFYDH
ncbi:MAG: recombinase family protein [Bacteroidota bacterium]